MHVEPNDGEALCSWLARLGQRLGLRPVDTALQAFGIESRHRPEWWRRPSSAEVAILARRTGLATERIEAMTLTAWAHDRSDERHERFGARGFQSQRARSATVRPTPQCSACLSADETPFIRLEWMIGWVAVCRKHLTHLTANCPGCGAALNLPGLSLWRPVVIGRCTSTRCERQMDDSHAAPALAVVSDIQARLLRLKHDGAGPLPGIGWVTWATLVGLVDLVLSALWRSRARHPRERLFRRIVIDNGLDPEQRLQIDWPSNYGTLLVLAWLFAEWPGRMTEAMELVRAPSLPELVGFVGKVGGAPDGQLVKLLAGSVPDRPPIEVEWRRWLDSLPETADMLRERSWREFRQGASERLRALADLRAGMDVATVARRSKLRTTTVERWLETGMEYGLDALISEQMHLSVLDPDQRAVISDWLESVSRFSKGPNAWCAEHAQHEIAIRFGILLTPSAAHSLYRRSLPPR
ncbi:TniQ family protein [Bradyrhizobium macuxiense]|nr:TniQ family protein [Bradyrhizobium macuxiense]